MLGRKNHFGFYAMFFTIGAIAGAATALFFAPTTGKKFQKQVKEVLDEQVENIQSAVRKVVNA